MGLFDVKDELTQKIEHCKNNNLSIDECVDYLKPEADHIGLKMNNDEICFYRGNATAFKKKNVVTKYKSGGSGFSFRLMKGITLRTGGGKSTPVRNDVIEKYDGDFFITNMRLVLLSEKYGFDVRRDKISRIDFNNDGFIVYIGEKSYSVMTNHVHELMYILKLSNEYIDLHPEKDLCKKKNEKKDDSKSIPQQIKEYKELLDCGAITEEEFEKKKKQLLDL